MFIDKDITYALIGKKASNKRLYFDKFGLSPRQMK